MADRRPPVLLLLSAVMRVLSRLSPRLASRIAFDLFRTPRRFRTPPRERALLADGEPFEIAIGEHHKLQAWSWGTGPLVILFHGWEGRGSQLGAFLRPLVEAGYRVVVFDAPGHGASTGRTSSLPHFAWALRGVAEAVGEPHAIIAHSLGCAAATLALRDGLAADRVVFLSPPLRPSDYTRQFGAMFGLSDRVVDGLRARVEERFLRKWDDFSLAAMAPHMKARLLVIHDREDVETPWSGGARLAELWPGAQLLTTVGLGHRRILREAATVDAATRFVREGGLALDAPLADTIG
ncbi:MAG TPA: alpha/beta fold hydrolase [Thermoanaerobaculia bacterium]|nr:alpha/beta fold hydrolase [Thermoanaerobaculia bacterium]